jgi:fructose-1-phosphate kinase PfkB-like protein
MSRVIAVGLSPTLQKTIAFKDLRLDSVNRSTGYRIDASGKAVNASRVLSQLERGCVTNVCPLGVDNADFFRELAGRDGLSFDCVDVPGRIRYCYTLVEPGTGRATELVVSEPAANADYQAIATGLLDLLDLRLAPSSALLFAGSRPAFWPEDLCARICALAKERECAVMADFHGKDLMLTLDRAVPDIIKINEEEFCGTFGFPFPLPEEELASCLARKSTELGCTIVVTRGSKDTYAASRGEGFRHPVNAVTALNAIGCGDSFTAGFLHSWLEDRDTAKALAKGSWCATRNALNLRPGSILDAEAEGEQLW